MRLPMHHFNTKTDIQKQIAKWRSQGLSIGFVPTMGNLHAGHLSLLDTAARHTDRIITSIYVNPSQFAAGEDFDNYPRTLAEDMDRLTETGKCHAVYTPQHMYSDHHSTMVSPTGVAEGLETASRPHFFTGVATIVLKLFNHVPADKAIFGEKDYQQLLVVRQMVHDLDMNIDIISSPTLRDTDGLALSSRNSYLSPDERQIAPALHHNLRDAAQEIESGKSPDDICIAVERQLLEAGFSSVDYVQYRHCGSLKPADKFEQNTILLASARLGSTRLIDNFLL